MTNNIKIVIADDNHFFTEALKDSLNNDTNFFVIQTANSIPNLITVTQTTNFDILILDINFNGESSLDYISDIRKNKNDFKIIALSTLNNNYTKTKAISLGVNCFIGKDEDFSTFSTKIKDCYTSNLLKNEATKSNKIIINNLKFTPRKIEILENLYKHTDKKEKELSSILNISESSLKTHKRELFEITNTKNLADLLKAGIELGILLPK